MWHVLVAALTPRLEVCGPCCCLVPEAVACLTATNHADALQSALTLGGNVCCQNSITGWVSADLAVPGNNYFSWFCFSLRECVLAREVPGGRGRAKGLVMRFVQTVGKKKCENSSSTSSTTTTTPSDSSDPLNVSAFGIFLKVSVHLLTALSLTVDKICSLRPIWNDLKKMFFWKFVLVRMLAYNTKNLQFVETRTDFL